MTYELPDALRPLKAWLRQRRVDVGALRTERHTAFMAQQLAGTRFKFPPKGSSCFPLLQRIQKALPEQSAVPEIGTRGRRDRGKKPPRQTANPIEVDRQTPAGLVIYSDGACEPNPGGGGWGFVVYRDGVEIHSESGGAAETTNNIMEMTGALMALRWFAERGVVEPLRLFSDSQYVVKGCNEWRAGWKKKGWMRGRKTLSNAELWQELDEALTLVPIHLEWCRGHSGIIGNERADELSLIGRDEALAVHAIGPIEQQLRYVV